jgi:hypothetical protein
LLLHLHPRLALLGVVHPRGAGVELAWKEERKERGRRVKKREKRAKSKVKGERKKSEKRQKREG